MSVKSFKAMVVQETADGNYTRAVQTRSLDDLPAGDVLIKVRYSSLNYKDALSATGNKGVTRRYPHTPGIDAAGIVEASNDKALHVGDDVLVTGYDLGMNTCGGFAQYIRVPASWVIKRPENLSLRETMIYGTAGFTAALCLHKLIIQSVRPEQGEILVTGATGGVGSVAVGLLARAGYKVVAATGKPDKKAFLQTLGAHAVIDRAEITDTPQKPLLKERWAGVVDTLGGAPLAAAIKSTRYGGSVASCGLVASAELPISVFPFILRGVNLLGVDSVNCAMPTRLTVWNKLANEWKLDQLEHLVHECDLTQLDNEIERILKGEQTGRVLVVLDKELSMCKVSGKAV